MVDTIVKLFTEVYLCVVENVENVSEFDKTFRVVLKYDTYTGRKKFNFNQGYENEIKISETKKNEEISVDLDMIMNISTSDIGKTVDLIFSNRCYNPKKHILSFCGNVSHNIQFVARYYLKLILQNLENEKKLLK